MALWVSDRIFPIRTWRCQASNLLHADSLPLCNGTIACKETDKWQWVPLSTGHRLTANYAMLLLYIMYTIFNIVYQRIVFIVQGQRSIVSIWLENSVSFLFSAIHLTFLMHGMPISLKLLFFKKNIIFFFKNNGCLLKTAILELIETCQLLSLPMFYQILEMDYVLLVIVHF